MDYEGAGNSGYRVYIYDHGMVGFALFLFFYFFSFRSIFPIVSDKLDLFICNGIYYKKTKVSVGTTT